MASLEAIHQAVNVSSSSIRFNNLNLLRQFPLHSAFNYPNCIKYRNEICQIESGNCQISMDNQGYNIFLLSIFNSNYVRGHIDTSLGGIVKCQ